MQKTMPVRFQTLAAALFKSLLVIWPLLLSVLSIAGCRVVRSTAEVPGKTVSLVTQGGKPKPVAVDPVEVQQTVLRFADEFAAGMTVGVDKLHRGTNALDLAETLQWKIALDTETCSIASGPNAYANLLDLTVFVSVARAALEEQWQPNVFGESAQPMVESCRGVETNLWLFAARMLTSAQQAELRAAIRNWRRQNPQPESVLAARAVGFASQVAGANNTDAAKPGSVFNLLMLDPLAGVDPAVREIAQSRLFAERALYVTQKMPRLVRWQAELLSLNAVRLPAVQEILANSTRITASVERFANVAEKLPAQVSTEREEILKALQSQEKVLTPLVNEVRQTLTAGSQMSTSLTTTLTTLDAVMKRFGVGETNNASPPDTNSPPFRIQDYTKAGLQLEVTARQLTELLVTLDRTIGSTNLSQLAAKVSPVVQQAQVGGKEVVDYAFWKGISLVAVVFVCALIYRFLVPGMTSARSKSNLP